MQMQRALIMLLAAFGPWYVLGQELPELASPRRRPGTRLRQDSSEVLRQTTEKPSAAALISTHRWISRDSIEESHIHCW